MDLATLTKIDNLKMATDKLVAQRHAAIQQALKDFNLKSIKEFCDHFKAAGFSVAASPAELKAEATYNTTSFGLTINDQGSGRAYAWYSFSRPTSVAPKPLKIFVVPVDDYGSTSTTFFAGSQPTELQKAERALRDAEEAVSKPLPTFAVRAADDNGNFSINTAPFASLSAMLAFLIPLQA